MKEQVIKLVLLGTLVATTAAVFAACSPPSNPPQPYQQTNTPLTVNPKKVSLPPTTCPFGASYTLLSYTTPPGTPPPSPPPPLPPLGVTVGSLQTFTQDLLILNLGTGGVGGAGGGGGGGH
jgi:hypothetical protein